MKRTYKFVSLGVLVVVAIAMCTIVLNQLSAAGEYNAKSLTDIEQHEGYVLRNDAGYVAVYYQNEDNPAFVTSIRLSTLRETDRQEIEAGYRVSTRDELMHILEDLGS